MRILFLTAAVEHIAGYWRVLYLAKHLAALGHNMTIVCQSNKPSFQGINKIVDGVKLHLLPSFVTSHKNMFQSAVLRALTLFMQTGTNIVGNIISKNDVLHTFDVMFPQNALPTILSKIMRTRAHKPIVFVDWDDWWGRGGILDLFYEGAYRTTIPFLTLMEEKMPLYADGVTVTNETLKNRAVGAGVKPENLFEIPNGANTEAIKPFDMYEARKRLNLPCDAVIYALHTRKAVFATQGKRPRRKNPILLAHKTVVDSFPNAFLLLLGRRNDKWIAEAESLNIDRNIICVNFQPIDMFSLYLAASNFFLLPMRDTAFDRARSPLRLMDYMAAGRPVIATALPEIKRVVNGCGLLVKPNANQNDLAAKILEAIQNPSLCKKMGEAALEKVVNQYSWQKIAVQLENAYRKYL